MPMICIEVAGMTCADGNMKVISISKTSIVDFAGP